MKFRTEIKLDLPCLELTHHDKMMFIGSCFSENISAHLERYHFEVNNGAHGILFHPIAIFRALQQIIDSSNISENDLVKAGHGWVSLAHHGSYHHETTDALIQRIHQDIQRSNTFLASSKLLVLTFGTAMGYTHLGQQLVVANCHRLPQQDFERDLTDLEVMKELSVNALEAITNFNPQIKIILTVSPVRHLREGFVENQRSKARLILLCEYLQKRFKCVDYFPSYEIQIDDLRDYRFYAEDMIHPSKQAIRYIAEKFEEVILSKKCRDLCLQIKPHVLQSEHRSLYESLEMAEKRKAESENQIRLLIQKG
jgi:hypothetical protein